MGGKGGGDIGLGEGEGKTMRREIVPLLLLHESKQADQERERREGKRCGEGGKDEEEQGGLADRRKRGRMERNQTPHQPTSHPPAAWEEERERKTQEKGRKEVGSLRSQSDRPPNCKGGETKRREGASSPPLPPSPSEPCHKESVLPAVVGENKRKRRREGKNGGGSELPSQHPASPFFSATVGGMWASGKRGCDFRELMMRHFWPKKGWRDEKVAECV